MAFTPKIVSGKDADVAPVRNEYFENECRMKLEAMLADGRMTALVFLGDVDGDHLLESVPHSFSLQRGAVDRAYGWLVKSADIEDHT